MARSSRRFRSAIWAHVGPCPRNALNANIYSKGNAQDTLMRSATTCISITDHAVSMGQRIRSHTKMKSSRQKLKYPENVPPACILQLIESKASIARRIQTNGAISIVASIGGAWQPAWINLELPPPKVTTMALSQHAFNNDLAAFIKEYRRINPGTSIEEAKTDFFHFRSTMEKLG